MGVIEGTGTRGTRPSDLKGIIYAAVSGVLWLLICPDDGLVLIPRGLGGRGSPGWVMRRPQARGLA